MNRRTMGLLALGVVLCAPPTRVDAANCTLRDPNRQIYAMFPDATRYRSVVERVDTPDRHAIEAALGTPLSFNDLGTHTLYVILDGEFPIGFVHARSEVGESGTVELVWALDLDLQVKDFRVQRSREKHTDVLKGEAFHEQLAGAGMERLLSQRGGKIARVGRGGPEASAILERAILSGAKTIAITGRTFHSTVERARLLGNVHRFFPDAAKATTVNASLEGATRPGRGGRADAMSDELAPESFRVLRARAQDDSTLGVLAFVSWVGHPAKPELWCAVSSDGVIRRALVVGAVESSAREAVEGLRGQTLASLQKSGASDPKRCVSAMLAVLVPVDGR